MAKQIASFVKGRIGNVVFYQLGNTYVTKSRPAHMPQTEATKARSRNFGLASSAGRILRSYFQELMPNPKDKNMQSCFSGAIAKWMGQTAVQDLPPQDNLPFINGFSFTTETNVAERLRVPLTVSTTETGLSIALPAFIPMQCITAPVRTVAVELLVGTAACGLQQREYRGGVEAVLQIAYNGTQQPAQQLLLAQPVTTGSLVVTVLAMRYVLTDGTVEQRAAFLPAGVVDARWVG